MHVMHVECIPLVLSEKGGFRGGFTRFTRYFVSEKWKTIRLNMEVNVPVFRKIALFGTRQETIFVTIAEYLCLPVSGDSMTRRCEFDLAFDIRCIHFECNVGERMDGYTYTDDF